MQGDGEPGACDQRLARGIEHRAAVEEPIAEPHDVRAAQAGVRLQIETQELAFPPVKNRRDAAARGDVQPIAIADQIALGRHAAPGAGRRMRLVQFERSGRVIAPDHAATGGVQGVYVDSFAGPDAGGKVHPIVHHDRSAPCRPAGNHPVVAQEHVRPRAAAVFPDQPAIGRGEAVQVAVVAGDQDAISPGDRGETHRSTREELPTQTALGCIQGVDLAVGRAAEIQVLAGDHGLIRDIESLPGATRPRRPWSVTRLECPRQ